MRDYVPRIHAAGGELVVLGNGSPEQAKWFVEDYAMTTPVFTDPALASHKVVGARRPMFFDPRSILRAIEARRGGFRQTGVKGSAMQLGGVFVLTPAGEAPYSFLSRFAGDHPPAELAVAALEAARTS